MVVDALIESTTAIEKAVSFNKGLRKGKAVSHETMGDRRVDDERREALDGEVCCPA